ncbi:hypothetical protein C0Q70_05707 [Pomacea canaliculata]|uniref:ATP-dependent (S)-NAD(P)H-hydrate dehydratase n=1 Tax=Pomacea canaliculata TaxID=400727 RepID=A0A2T7PM02_POMCA|nr:hypothetical protein C0Q70_05707 [Pomacea canaliculata]
MYLKGDRFKGCLEILRLVTEHNHPIGPDVSYKKSPRIRELQRNGSSKKKLNSILDPVPDLQSNKSVGNSIGVSELQATVKEIIPPLTSNLFKGQAGCIGIIGGCQEYTGAPYFAAISALKVGADVSHVFCTKDAGIIIKCYSPDLIVLPILDHSTALTEFEKWLPKLHTLVVGPGLGRDQQVLETVTDGLFLITETPELITNYQNTLLTPNIIEFQTLFEKMVGDRPCQTDEPSNVKLLAQCLGNVTILRKGSDDIISDGSTVIMCSTDGSPRRCGGQGDVLSGVAGVFFNWALSYHNSKTKLIQQRPDAILGPGVLAAFMACRLTRECSRLAFAVHGRSMTATDMLVNIHAAFEGMFLN